MLLRGKERFMSNIRLIATDLDGTFFDAHSQIIPANVDAFRQAQASGIAVAICSGRCPVDIRYVLFIIDKLAGASHLIDEMVIVTD